jgi:hypothetical protein
MYLKGVVIMERGQFGISIRERALSTNDCNALGDVPHNRRCSGLRHFFPPQ